MLEGFGVVKQYASLADLRLCEDTPGLGVVKLSCVLLVILNSLAMLGVLTSVGWLSISSLAWLPGR